MDSSTLYIADTSNHRIVVIQPSSTNAAAILGSGAGAASDKFNQPTDVFVTSSFIYVLDSTNFRVQKWPRNGVNGTTVAGTGTAGTSSTNNAFDLSHGIYVDKYGYLYVSDKKNHRVLRFPPDSTSGTNGTVVAGIGISGSGPSHLNLPYRIVVDDNRNIYIADKNNHRIQMWAYGACAGVTVAGTGTSGSSLNQLSSPISMLVDMNGFIYITDQGNNRILRWSLSSCAGECIAGCSGVSGNATNTLNGPFALAFDSNGSLYVSDNNNHRIQRFSTSSGFGE